MRDIASILPVRLDEVSYEVGGQKLLDRVSVTIGAGPRTAILGPNGAGKSLFLRICHGLLTPTSGSVVWSGNAERARIRQAMVFQRPIVLRRSLLANIMYALALQRVPRAARRERAHGALVQVGLVSLANRPAWVLSTGEQQRLALARALALNPEVLFLDEPTANLDPAATRAVEEAIAHFQASGTKIIMTTHDLGQARRIADEVLFLCGGRLLEHLPAAQFFDRPASIEAQAFIRGELTP